MNASQGEKKKCTVIAITNQKGGVGKTTTAMNLSVALSRSGNKVLVIDMDPHGNLTQGFGISIKGLEFSIRDLITNRSVTFDSTIQQISENLFLIGANPDLEGIFRWMITSTNAELRLKQRIAEIRTQYDFVIIDSCPGLGVLLNSTLNAADVLLIPVDTGFYGYLGVQELFNVVEEIRQGTNPGLRVLGFVLTMTDRTLITQETHAALKNRFGDLVFNTSIRRSVALKESPAVGKSIFEYSAMSNGADDYAALSHEVMERSIEPTDVLFSVEREIEVAHG